MAPTSVGASRTTPNAGTSPAPSPSVLVRSQGRNPFTTRLHESGAAEPPRSSRKPMRFFRASSPPPKSRAELARARTTQPLPRGWRISKYGHVLRPNEVDFFEEEDRQEDARKQREQNRQIRLAEAREQRALQRSAEDRARILDERYPFLPQEGTEYWEAGLSQVEQQSRLARARERFFNIVVRHRCDPCLYEQNRHRYLPTERILDPIHDHTEIEKLRRHRSLDAMAPASWVCGNKFVYIDRHRHEFEAASESDRPDIYRAVARGLMCLAGDAPFDFNFRTHDIDDGEPEPTQADHDRLTNTNGLSADECKRRRSIIYKLGSDISQYYRRKDQQLNKPTRIDFARIARGSAGKIKIGVSTRPYQYYSTLYYTERVKATFEERYAAELKAWEQEKAAAEANGTPFTKDCPTDVGVRTTVTSECWARETPEFRAMVEKMHAEELERQREAAKQLVGCNLPSTPEEFQKLYDTAGYQLQPITDAISTAFKGVVAVMICAPMPEDGGNLGVVSIHSGMSQGIMQAKWPYGVCKDGFRRAEQELLDFGEHVFTLEEKLAAAIPLTGPNASSSSTSASPQTQPEDAPAPSSNVNMNDSTNDNATTPPETEPSNDYHSTHADEMPLNDEDMEIPTHDEIDEDTEMPTGDDIHEDTEVPVHDEHTGASEHDTLPRPSTPSPAAEPLFLFNSSPLAPSQEGQPLSASRDGSPSSASREEEVPPHAPSHASFRASSQPPQPPTLDIPPSQPVPSLARQRTMRTSSAPSALGSSSAPSAHEAWKMPASSTWSEHLRLFVEGSRRGQTWAAAFGDVVHSYVKFEEVHGFPTKDAGFKIISNKTIRPSQYSLWTKMGRKYDRLMPVKDVDEYGQQWWRWLAAHLPVSCRMSNSYLLDLSRVDLTDSATWNGLDKACGKDGMLQLVLSLMWWGDAVYAPGGSDATRHDNWEAACVELDGILRHMTTSTVKTGNKRKSSESGDGTVKKKPRQSSTTAATTSKATLPGLPATRRRRR
ncbi:hypothetical protein EV122DRAFT_294247 [Schizophyllum commune]